MLKNKYLLKPVLIAVLVICIYEIVSLKFNFFSNIKLKTSDLFSRIKYQIKPVPKEAKDIVIISIDNRAYDYFERKWPWPRIIHTTLIYKLIEYRPKIIVFNLAFIGKSQKEEEDTLLAQAIKDAGNIYAATYYDMAGRYHPPYIKFTEALKGYGTTTKPVDKDSVIRHAGLFNASISGIILDYSLEFMVACDFLGIPLDDVEFNKKTLTLSNKRSIQVKKDGLVGLNYEAALKDLVVVPILDLLQDKADPDIFSGKIVILGMTGESFGDIHSTPLGPLPGAVIVANNILMILHHAFIKEVPKWIYFAGLILFNIFLAASAYRTNIKKGFVYLLSFVTIYYAISLVLALNNIVWDYFTTPFISLCIFITINLQRLYSILGENLFLKKQVLRDTATGLPSPQYFYVRLKMDLEIAVKANEKLSLVIFRIHDYSMLKSKLTVKEINSLLKQIAQLLVKYSRKTRHIDFISRYSEECFGVVLRKTTLNQAKEYAERIKRIVESRLFGPSGEISLYLDKGIAEYPAINTESADELIKFAEKELKT